MTEPHYESESTEEVLLLRIVRQSVLRAEGRATDTGLHLVFYAPDAAGRDAWALGEAWGWTPEELQVLHDTEDHLLAVVQTPGDRWGRASAEALAALLADARGADLDRAEAAEILSAFRPAPADAERLAKLRARIADILGVPVGALDRIPRRGEPVEGLAFLLDEKIDDDAEDGLAAGSALRLTDYPDIPTVIRLPWHRRPEG